MPTYRIPICCFVRRYLTVDADDPRLALSWAENLDNSDVLSEIDLVDWSIEGEPEEIS